MTESKEVLRPLICSYMHIDKKDKPKTSDAMNEKMATEGLRFAPLRGVICFGEGDYDHEKLARVIKSLQEIYDKKR